MITDLPAHQAACTDDRHAVLADLGYKGEDTRLVCLIKNTRGVTLTAEQRTINALHSVTRALAERGNSLLETTFKGGPGPAPPRTRPHHMIIPPS